MDYNTIISVLIWLYYITIGFTILSIILDNRNPSKTTGFILILIFLPAIGLIIYLFFGQDFKKRKIFKRKSFKDNLVIKDWLNKNQEVFKNNANYAENELGEKYLVAKLLQQNQAQLTLNNYVKILKNGEEKFAALKTALRSAQSHIHLEYYIIEDDHLIQEILEILYAKVNDGVEVRVIFDEVGSREISSKLKREITEKGVELHGFMPVQFPLFTSRANYRNHRKIAVVDGDIGFVGGINLSTRYLNNNTHSTYWRDTHLQIQGEAVWQLQNQFMLMWNFVSGESLPIQYKYFPEMGTFKNTAIQICASGPDSDWASIMLAFFKAISVAKRSILITTPYFIPNDQILTAIQSAALSGVEVKLLIPLKSDSKIVQVAMMSYVKELLIAGAQVFLYKKGFVHAKTLVVDNILSTVGTANMDYRSFNINFEINAFIYNREQAEILTNHFYTDIEDAEELSLTRWEKRPLTKKLMESTARLLAPIL